MANSRYFRSSIEFNGIEKFEYSIEDVYEGTLKAIKEFCYTGCIELSTNNVESFIEISSYLQFDYLEAKCWKFYSDNLDNTNVVDTLIIADKFCNDGVRKLSFELLCSKLEVIPCDRLHATLMRELLSSDDIECNEVSVFKRLLEWHAADECERTGNMVEFLRLIRMKHLTTEFINCELLHSTLKKFELIDLLLIEYRNRISNTHIDPTRRRRTSIYIVVTEDENESSKIVLSKYRNYKFKNIYSILISNRIEYSSILCNDTLYIFGGRSVYMVGGRSDVKVLKRVC